jgi:hypothetical protein
MLGKDAFCPKSGAPLSEERHYDESGHPRRAVEADGDGPTATAGELTNGARRSTTRALLRHFRRCHERHHEADPTLYRTASTSLCRLKRTATGRQAWDVHVWYALRHHLRRQGHDVEWMGAHAGLRCPGCHGRLRFERRGAVVTASCGSNCDGTGTDRLPEIRSAIARLVAAAFDADDPPTTDDVLQFDA